MKVIYYNVFTRNSFVIDKKFDSRCSLFHLFTF